MEYRELPHGGEKISVLGLGMGYISGTTEEVADIIKTAIAGGINYFDLAAAERAPYAGYAQAFAGQRDKVYTQMHFGATYESGKYGWTRDLETIKRTFEWEIYSKRIILIWDLFTVPMIWTICRQ